MYKLTLERLIEFMKLTYKVPDIHIYQIGLWFLEKFYQFLHKKYKCSTNTTIKYMKRFASIMNFAQKTGLIQVTPFNIFRFHTEKKEPVYLTEEELKRIMDKEFVTERLAVVRDAFVFSCYTGLSFSDIANLKFSDIQERNSLYRIRTGRRKTDSVSYIPLLDIPMKILDRYRRKYSDKCKEINKIEVETEIKQADRIADDRVFPIRSNQVTNEFLKEIADVCGIGKKVSYHTARHTFATLALSNGVSLESVSKMMGHTSIRTTQVYAQITNLKVKEEMEVMADRLKGNK
nr:site-specific integrase [Dysgonomonas sp. ZJ709]